MYLMVYSSEYQIMKYFSSILCQDILLQYKMKYENNYKKFNDLVCFTFIFIYISIA